MSSPVLKNFKVFLFQLSEKLNKRDIEGIIFMEELPPDFEGQSPLKILLKLEMMGRISASKLGNLEEVLKSINRVDLAKKVKEFTKSQKKAIKKSGTALDSLQEREQTLAANLEVALVQMRLLRDQLAHVQRTVQETGPRAVEAIVLESQDDAEQLEGKLLHAKSQAKLVRDDQSSSLDSSGSLYSPSPPAPLAAYRPKKPFEQELEEKIRSPPRTVPQAGEGTCNTQQHVVAQVFVVIVVAVVDSLFCALVLALQCVQQSYSIVHFGTKVAL